MSGVRPEEPPGRRLVLVSGPPGAGKTTLAGPLAAELGFALVGKDRIKETLHDAMGVDGDLGWSRRLGAASMELLWALAADAPAAVLEANFWPDDRLSSRVRALGGRAVEVHCACPLDECRRRHAERAPVRHSAHVDQVKPELAPGAALPAAPAADTFTRSAVPLQIGPLIAVDTTRPVDVVALAASVRRLLLE